MKKLHLSILSLGLGLLPVAAHAAPPTPQDLKFQFAEVGGNVVGTASGSVNRSAFGPGNSTGVLPQVSVYGGGYADLMLGTTSPTCSYYNVLTLISGTGSPWGSNSSSFNADTQSGLPVFIGGDGITPSIYFGFDDAYVSGASISASNTWNSKTLAVLGLNTGTWKFGYGSAGDTVTLEIGGSGGAVPEPGEWAAMGILGAGLAGLVLRKRRAK